MPLLLRQTGARKEKQCHKQWHLELRDKPYKRVSARGVAVYVRCMSAVKSMGVYVAKEHGFWVPDQDTRQLFYEKGQSMMSVVVEVQEELMSTSWLESLRIGGAG